jgi:hypothetical protein
MSYFLAYPFLAKIANLYYKERKQLKIFLTQIGFALPLTPDPPDMFLEVDKV